MVGSESSDSAIYSNRDTQASWKYHTATNHTWHSVSTSSHYMDWNNQPRPFKIYPDLPEQRLPTGFPSSGMSALDSLTGGASGESAELTLENLAGLLYYSAGVTKGAEGPGGRMFFRAAACTGALYHIELYLVCGDLPDLEAGVYQFGAHDFALRRLREGDFRGVLAEASAGEPSVADAPVVIVTTSVYWRNSWKYQDRAYRHCYWDSGVILANLLAMGNAYRLPLKVVASFADGPVNRLLDLDEQREVALQLVPVGRSSQPPVLPAGEVVPLGLRVEPYSRREVDYPAIREMHAASSLSSPEEASGLRGSPPPLKDRKGPEPQGTLFPLDLPPTEELPQDTIEEVIIRRGSSRRFRRESISYRQLSTMLDRATRGVGADFLEEPGAAQSPEHVPTLNQLYLIVNDVDGLPAGSYVFHRDRGALEQLQAGEMRETAGRLDLGQELASDASVNVYFLTDLNAVLERYGNRGYRMAQMEASTMGGRLYLGAYAQRLGATGLTFFDDEVTEFFSPHAEGKSVMFLVAVGRSTRRRRTA